jgi:glutaredoxin
MWFLGEVMEIIVYGKKKCGKCEAAKDKLTRMGFSYISKDLDYFTSLHDGWRTDGSVQIRAESSFLEETVPMICIDDRFFDYPTAMKFLKNHKKSVESEKTHQGTREAVFA